MADSFTFLLKLLSTVRNKPSMQPTVMQGTKSGYFNSRRTLEEDIMKRYWIPLQPVSRFGLSYLFEQQKQLQKLKFDPKNNS